MFFRKYRKKLKKLSFIADPAEQYVASQLEGSFRGMDYGIFHNILIPYDNRVGSSQIDHLVVSVHGIFCIETKKHAGVILGSKLRQIFTQVLRGKNYPIKPNPVIQNDTHIRALGQLLTKSLKEPIMNIVVFPYSFRCHIDGYEHVGQIDDMYNWIANQKRNVYTYSEAALIMETINIANMKHQEAHALHAHSVNSVHA